MLTVIRRTSQRLSNDNQGVAALEFALVLPLMIALVFGVYELSEPMIIYQQVYSAAHSIPASASSIAVQGDGSTTLTYAQVQFEESTIFAEIPALRNGAQNGGGNDSVTISSIVFEPKEDCAPNAPCNYSANVVWSVAYTGGNSPITFKRLPLPCGVLQPVAPNVGLADTLQTVSTNTSAWPDPILVANVTVDYHPLLLSIPQTNIIPFSASGYWPVRSVKAVSVNDGNTTRLLPDQQYTTLTGTNGAPAGSFCVNSSYPETS